MRTKDFTQEELRDYFNNSKIYFLSYNKFYRLMVSQNTGFYFQENTYLKNNSKLPYTKKGRFHAFTYESIINCDFIE